MLRPEPAGDALLRTIQSELMAAIAFAEQPPSTEGLIRNRKGLDAEAQLGIYAQAVTATWVTALSQTFPAARRWIGEEAFYALARRYLATHPSRSGDLEQLGEGFPAFIAAGIEPEAAELAELCRFEWLVNQLRLAPDVEALGEARLASIDIEALAASRLRLIPRAALFASAHSVVSCWNGEAEPTWEADHVLLIFDELLTIRTLSSAQMSFFERLIGAPSLQVAIHEARPSLEAELPELIAFTLATGALSTGVAANDWTG